MDKLDLNMVFSEEFLKTDFPRKRVILKDYLLEENILVEMTQRKINLEQVKEIFIGQDALCFEDHQQDSEGSGYRWYLSSNDTSEKLKSITANKFYKILDIRDNDEDIVIKINSDSGRKSWVMASRFLYGEVVLRKLRAEKLKQLF
jgi:hypothetical protein